MNEGNREFDRSSLIALWCGWSLFWRAVFKMESKMLLLLFELALIYKIKDID